MSEGTVMLCVDDSELSRRAVEAGLRVLSGDLEPIIATVRHGTDPALVTGAGHSGSTIDVAQYREMESLDIDHSEALLADVQQSFGLQDARVVVLEGEPGPAICRFADEESVAAIVIGSRGRSGFRRAVLGSVSDHVVRHAECPVIVTTVDHSG